MLMCFVERLTVEASCDEVRKSGAFEDILVRAMYRVIDGLAGSLSLRDLVIELSELVLSEPLPVVDRDGVWSRECLLLRE